MLKPSMSIPGKAADMEDVRRLSTPGQTARVKVQRKGSYGFLQWQEEGLQRENPP